MHISGFRNPLIQFPISADVTCAYALSSPSSLYYTVLTQFALGAVAESADPALLALAAERPAALSALAAGQSDALVAHLPLPPDVAAENRLNEDQ